MNLPMDARHSASKTIDHAQSLANERSARLRSFLIGMLVFAATVFNFFLSFVHTNVTAISKIHIIVIEIVIVLAASALAFGRGNLQNNPWFYVITTQVALIFFLMIFRDDPSLKPIRDAIIMPIFIALGIMATRFNLIRFLTRLNVFILAVALVEIFFLRIYTQYFDIIDYFISKGATPEAQRFYNDTLLFVSAVRGSGRFLLDVPGLHRVSSVFLEPISAGVFGSVSGFIFLAYRAVISRSQYYLGLTMAFFLIWLADGRLSLGMLAVCVLARPFLRRYPARCALLILPAVAALSIGIYLVDIYLADIRAAFGEGFVTRLAKTMGRLASFDFFSLMGLGGLNVSMVDTGLGYILKSQGILGFLLFWLAPILLSKPRSEPARLMVFFTAIYFAFGLFFTASIFTIKTAALLWVAYGYTLALNYQHALVPTGRHHRVVPGVGRVRFT